jgi:hypothetical protein
MRIPCLLFICLLLFEQVIKAQSAVQPTIPDRISIGIEQDILPYLTGGYFFAAWAGNHHFRGRAVLANVRKPDWIIPEGFTNNQVKAYALLGDYFLQVDWKGWWIGGGLVYWDSSIQSDAQLSTTHYQNVLLNGSLGYSWKFWKRFYVSPWAGMHIRVGGDTDVVVDGKHFTPPLFNPEASIKIGFIF